ncbi:MAG: integrase core domain-containing protein [Vulcanimicrobiaceae bacterium]
MAPRADRTGPAGSAATTSRRAVKLADIGNVRRGARRQSVGDVREVRPRCSQFSDSGKPTKNAHVESLNGRIRDELLNIHGFATLLDARMAAERSSRAKSAP